MRISVICQNCEESQTLNVPIRTLNDNLFQRLTNAGWECDSEDNFTCPKCIKKEKQSIIPEKLYSTLFLHGGKEDSHYLLDELEKEGNFKFTDEIRKEFGCVGCEVSLEIELDTKNLKVKVLRLNNFDISNLNIEI